MHMLYTSESWKTTEINKNRKGKAEKRKLVAEIEQAKAAKTCS